MRCELKRLCIGTGAVALSLLPLWQAVAQESGTNRPVASSSEDRSQLANYVRVMTSELERAEARVKSVTEQLVSLDDDIESRVNRLVSLLSSVRDSAEGPNSRMRKAKEEALAGLKATAVYYAQERDRRKREMGNAYALIDDEALARDVAALNARIETRVTQSLEIAASLSQHKEGQVDRYGDGNTDYANETPEYRKTQRDVRASVKDKTDMVGTLRASIDKLTRDVAAREAELKTTNDPQRQAQLAEDIKTMRQTINARRGQIEELVTAPQSATRAVSSKAAFEMDKMIDEMTRELRADFAKFKALVSERDAARARLKPLKERLAKASAMLETSAVSSP